MTRNMLTGVMVMASVGALTGSTARAQRDALEPTRVSPISFRLAADTPMRGFDAVTVDGMTVYVSGREALSGADVTSARSYATSYGNDVDMTLTRDGADRLNEAVQAQMADSLAVYANGRLIAVGTLEFDNDTGRATLSGVGELQAQQFTRALNDQMVPRDGARVSVVVSQQTLRPDDTVMVEVFASDVMDLRSYQIKLAVTGGTSGSIVVDELYIDGNRSDHVFGTLQKFDAVDQMGRRLGGVLMSGSVDATTPAYLGTYVLRASSDAAGTFNVNVQTRNRSSLLWTSSNVAIPFAASSASLTVGKTGRKRITDR